MSYGSPIQVVIKATSTSIFFARGEKRCGLYRSVKAIKLYESASIIACAPRVCGISRTAARGLSGPLAHYGAAKAALEYYTRTLAMELAPRGVRVNVVSPGVISTPGPAKFAKTTPGFSSDDWLRNIPLGRIGNGEDIAEVVALLVSDHGKFITGANYRVDGGMAALTNVRFQRGSVN